MKPKQISYGILRAIGVLVGISVLIWFLYEIQSVIVYLAIASVISLIGRPIVVFLRRKFKMGKTLAAIITILIIFLFIFGILALFIPIIITQSQKVANIDFDKVQVSVNELYSQIADYFGINKMTLIDGVRNMEFVKNFDYGVIPSFLNSMIGNLGAAVVGIFAVIFIAFFFLRDSRLLVHSILVFAKRGEEGKFLRALEKIKYLLSRYFTGLILQVLIIFVLYAIVLNILRIENAFAIALFCAVLNLVPYLGPLVGGAIMLLLATSSNLGADFQTVILPKLTWILIGYSITQLIDNFIVQPYVFGNSVKSHPLEIFLAIIIAGLLFGVFGMVLAIPVYTAIKVISNEFLSEYKIVQKLTKGL